MKRVLALILSGLLSGAPALGADALTLQADKASVDITVKETVGTIEVGGLGTVTVVAAPRGRQVILRAYTRDNQLVGKAETTVGLRKTPIYVTTPSGLKKLVIVWSP